FVGGGIYTRTGTQKINGSRLLSNSALAGSGNVCVDSEGQISCLPKGSGGAVAIKGGSAALLGDTIAQNTAASGGVLYNAGATVNITNAALVQNSAVNGAVLSNGGGTGTLTSVTAFQNSASAAGGV